MVSMASIYVIFKNDGDLQNQSYLGCGGCVDSVCVWGCGGASVCRYAKVPFRIWCLEKNIKILFLRNCKEDEAETWHTCLGHCPLQKLCFYSGRIRTLVAMATNIFHRLIMGKV